MTALTKVESRLQLAAMSYREFIAQGHPDAEWEAYRDAQNALSRQRAFAAVVHDWNSGKSLSGNAIANFFRSQNVKVPTQTQRLLDDDATTVSKTQVVARGLPRKDALALLKFVSTHMHQLEGI